MHTDIQSWTITPEERARVEDVTNRLERLGYTAIRWERREEGWRASALAPFRRVVALIYTDSDETYILQRAPS